MNKEEQNLIASAETPERMFTRLWTQKEAVVKAQGVGISSFEQLQEVLVNPSYNLETIEKEKYIYSIAYGKLHCFGS
jgi:phosphopantetheinyl transferase